MHKELAAVAINLTRTSKLYLIFSAEIVYLLNSFQFLISVFLVFLFQSIFQSLNSNVKSEIVIKSNEVIKSMNLLLQLLNNETRKCSMYSAVFHYHLFISNGEMNVINQTGSTTVRLSFVLVKTFFI